MKKHGSFSPNGLEYVVTTPHAPRDWFNFLWNPTYLACAGLSFNGCSLFQSEAGVVTNLFGKQDKRDDPRWVYLRDRDTGEVWSAGWLPCWTEHAAYECRHGLGYSVLTTERNGIRVAFRLFVPRAWSGEVWTIEVTNVSRRPRRISVFPVANVLLDGVNMPYGYVGGLSAEFLARDNMLFFRNTTYTVVNEKYRAFLSSDRRIARWDVSRDHFLGRFRNEARPERVVDGRLGNSVASAEYLVGATQYDLALRPRVSWKVNLVLGIVLDLSEARRMKAAFRDSARIEREFEALRRQNLRRVQGLALRTPDADFNRLFSVWLKHQLHLMADWARFYFKGYRDTCQDAAGMSILDAPRAIAMLKKALRHQRSDGFCPRAFRVPSMDIAAADKHYADSPSWISHATEAILSETGDLSLLGEKVEYSDRGRGTIWEHNLRAVEFLWNDRGRHGLSLMHHGDWNDLMDKVGAKGRGESVWMSFALARALRLLGRMADWRGEPAIARRCERRFRELRRAILRHGWDGRHFLYAINDDGMRIGTSKAKEARVFINPQSWSMLSGVVDARRYTRIAKAIEPIVDTRVGPVHSWPPVTRYHPGIGQFSGTPPGFFTNGNVYCHAASFKVAADFEADRVDKAFDTLMRILPSAEKGEPYAQVNGYVGPSALRVKRHVSDDPWRTGTVAWNFLNVVDRLLGFRRTLEGFRLRPRLPSKWKRAAYTRPFRGTPFEIEIRRGPRRGVWLDGKRVAGDLIRVPVGGLGVARARVRCVV